MSLSFDNVSKTNRSTSFDCTYAFFSEKSENDDLQKKGALFVFFGLTNGLRGLMRFES